MEKLTIQNVIDAFAAQGGITKKTAEAVARTFFDVVVEGLNADGVVKINGFGTFKVITVADRESVNVNNGERIVIEGYKKVTFTPAENAAESAPIIEKKPKKAAPKPVKKAAPKAAAPIAEAPKVVAPKAVAPKVEAPKTETPKAPKEEKGGMNIFVKLLVVILLICIVVFAIRLFGNKEEQPVQAEPEVIEEEIVEEVVEEVAPKVHVLQPGEFLAKISKDYYGTEDSVAAIIRLNNLTNPDNVPVGTELLLP